MSNYTHVGAFKRIVFLHIKTKNVFFFMWRCVRLCAPVCVSVRFFIFTGRAPELQTPPQKQKAF